MVRGADGSGWDSADSVLDSDAQADSDSSCIARPMLSLLWPTHCHVPRHETGTAIWMRTAAEHGVPPSPTTRDELIVLAKAAMQQCPRHCLMGCIHRTCVPTGPALYHGNGHLGTPAHLSGWGRIIHAVLSLRRGRRANEWRRPW